MGHMQHCLETASSLLPVEQPGCLAILLSPLTFPLVPQLPLFPVCAGAEPNFHLLPAWPTFPRVPEHWVWEGGMGVTPLRMEPAQPYSLLSSQLQQPRVGGASCYVSCGVQHEQPWEQRLSKSLLEGDILSSGLSHRKKP